MFCLLVHLAITCFFVFSLIVDVIEIWHYKFIIFYFIYLLLNCTRSTEQMNATN